jgi:hypothetical protein
MSEHTQIQSIEINKLRNQYDPTLKDTPVNYRNKYQFCDIDDEPF